MASSLSLSKLLSEVPSLQELCENVRTAKWRALGTMLELETCDLDNIERKENLDERLSEMYTLWLQKKGSVATREALLKALKSNAVGEVALADNYYSKKLQTEDVSTSVYIIKVYVNVRI